MTGVRRDRALAVALRAEGMAVREIAERLGVSRATVAAWLRRPLTVAVRACAWCGELFVPGNGRQRFCTPAHRREHARGGPLVRDCRLCGAPFVPASAGQRYCSPAHRREHLQRSRAPRTVADWRERVVALEAEIARVRGTRGSRGERDRRRGFSGGWQASQRS